MKRAVAAVAIRLPPPPLLRFGVGRGSHFGKSKPNWSTRLANCSTLSNAACQFLSLLPALAGKTSRMKPRQELGGRVLKCPLRVAPPG